MIRTHRPSTGLKEICGDIIPLQLCNENTYSVGIVLTDDVVDSDLMLDVISTSEAKDRFRNKDCDHIKLDGDIFLGALTNTERRIYRDTAVDRSHGSYDLNFTTFVSGRKSISLPIIAYVNPYADLCLRFIWRKNLRGASYLREIRIKRYVLNGVDTVDVVDTCSMTGGTQPLWYALGFESEKQSMLPTWNHSSGELVSDNTEWKYTQYIHDNNRWKYRATTGYYYRWYSVRNKVWYERGKDTGPIAPTGSYRYQTYYADITLHLQDCGMLTKTDSWRLYGDLEPRVSVSMASQNNFEGVWPELMVRALANTRILDQNLAMTLVEWKNLKADLTDWLTGLSRLPKELLSSKLSALKKAKRVASGFLGGLYGYRLTFAEACKMGQRIERFTQDIAGTLHSYRSKSRSVFSWPGDAQYSDAEVTCNYSLTCAPLDNAFSELYCNLRKFSAWVTTEDAWDFIPFSFVVDWFFDISKYLSAVDTIAETQNLDVEAIVKSIKLVTYTTASHVYPEIARFLLQDCGIEVGLYSRWCEYSFDSPPLSPEVGQIPEVLGKHWPELSALIVQIIP